MRGFLTKMRTETIFRAIIMVIAGGLLFAFPGAAQQTIANVIAVILIILGIIRLVNYFRMSKGESTVDGLKEYGATSDLVIGILLIVLAGVCAAILVNMIPVVLGIVILISGLLKLEQGLALKNSGGNGKFVLIMAIITIVIGLFSIFHPSAVNDFIIQILGAGLIFGGVSDLISVLMTPKQ